MPLPAQPVPGFLPPQERYGKASHHDFDNPAKWVTVSNVPVLDEHVMTNERGQQVTTVDREDLVEIARNNNRRVFETGDPAPLIIGHTSDDTNAREKPVVGYAVNYRVKPFKRDRQGNVTYAIHADYKVRARHKNVIEDFPRRSVELWWHKKELDPIAMLGGTTPERDLGVVIRKARVRDILLGAAGPAGAAPLKFSRTAERTVLRYAMDDTDEGDDMAGANCGTGMRHRYADDGATDDLPPGDDDLGDTPGDDGGEDDPLVAKVFASKHWQAAKDEIVQEILAALDGGGDQGGGMPPGGAGGGAGGGAPMPGGRGGMPAPEEDERRMHGEQPVQFMSTGFPGTEAGYIPTTGTTMKPKRNARQPQPGPQRPAPQAPAETPEVLRLKRTVNTLVMKLARADAERTIAGLQAEGIVFANPEAEVEFLAQLDPAAQKAQIEEVYKKNYQRRQPDPGEQLSMPGLARYARNPEGQADDPGDFSPEPGQQAVVFADLQTTYKMSRADAAKKMREIYGRSANGHARR